MFDALFFLALELVVIITTGMVGTWLLWRWKKDTSYWDLLRKYGYHFGLLGAVAFTIALFLFAAPLD